MRSSQFSECLPLEILLEQSLAIQAWVAEGVARAAEELCEIHAVDSEIEVDESWCCRLGQFGSSAHAPESDDLVAGALLSFRGPLSGAALLTMEPEAALEWSRADAAQRDPVGTFLRIAGQVLESVILSASTELDVQVELGNAKLVESSVAGCLLQTHAPSDTVLIRNRLEIYAGRRTMCATLHLLMEPKVVLTILGALRVSVH